MIRVVAVLVVWVMMVAWVCVGSRGGGCCRWGLVVGTEVGGHGEESCCLDFSEESGDGVVLVVHREAGHT
ncbi:putative proline-rich receptor-like protein kinase PERK2 [Iris pallida]|uniref:Proline-rich receptor-like protein kinase PERK2 n=1 Tax=Iris pallida TaxID=29817 RepID=A0AAX6HJD7_IRIPA|nr:putative proline-rich receptor-like protein kinase PERK2 [Iris pallida]